MCGWRTAGGGQGPDSDPVLLQTHTLVHHVVLSSLEIKPTHACRSGECNAFQSTSISLRAGKVWGLISHLAEGHSVWPWSPRTAATPISQEGLGFGEGRGSPWLPVFSRCPRPGPRRRGSTPRGWTRPIRPSGRPTCAVPLTRAVTSASSMTGLGTCHLSPTRSTRSAPMALLPQVSMPPCVGHVGGGAGRPSALHCAVVGHVLPRSGWG